MEEEKAREKENEKDAEVMAVVAAEVNGGEGGEGESFYKKSGRERGPFRRRDRRRRGERRGENEEEEDGGGERTMARGGSGAQNGGRGRTTSAMIRQKIRCTAIGCSQFELLASPVAVRQSLPDLLDTRSLSPFLSFVPSFSVSSVPVCSACAAAAAAGSSVEPPSPPLPPPPQPLPPRLGGMGAGEKGRKNFEKKIQFRCHGDRRALTLIKIPRTSHLRRHRRRRHHRRRPLVLFHRLVLRPLRSPLLPSPCFPRRRVRRRRFHSFSDCVGAPHVRTCLCCGYLYAYLSTFA